MCISTHHKGGTVWMRSVFRPLADKLGLAWANIWNENRYRAKVPATGRAILVNWNGWFPPALWKAKDAAFLHLIRDPRDILLSGCSYHQRPGLDKDGFLYVPRAELGGRSYQEHLAGLDTREDKLLFEMTHKHAETVAEMRAWPYGHARSTELRYEELMQDLDGTLFERALKRLGLAGDELRVGLESFWNNSLFGGLKGKTTWAGLPHHHVASHGKVSRWRDELPRAVGEVYAERFGDDLVALGYETDTSWVETLPDTPEPCAEVATG